MLWCVAECCSWHSTTGADVTPRSLTATSEKEEAQLGRNSGTVVPLLYGHPTFGSGRPSMHWTPWPAYWPTFPISAATSSTTTARTPTWRGVRRRPAATPPRHSPPRARTGRGAAATVPSSGRPAPPMGPAHPKDLPGRSARLSPLPRPHAPWSPSSLSLPRAL
jgi:hypothetical protein